MDTCTLSPEVKRPWREADRSPYLWPRIRTSRALLPLSHIPSRREEGLLYLRHYLESTSNFLKWRLPFRFSDEHLHECFIPFHMSHDHTISRSLKRQPNNVIFGQQHKLWRSFIMEHPLTSCYTKDTQHTTQHSMQHATTDWWTARFWPTTV